MRVCILLSLGTNVYVFDVTLGESACIFRERLWEKYRDSMTRAVLHGGAKTRNLLCFHQHHVAIYRDSPALSALHTTLRSCRTTSTALP